MFSQNIEINLHKVPNDTEKTKIKERFMKQKLLVSSLKF